jgi:hypothetical protein
MVAQRAILIRYSKHTANTRAVYDSIDGPAGRPTDNPPNSNRLGVYHGTVPECVTAQEEWVTCIRYEDSDAGTTAEGVAHLENVGQTL